MQNTYKDKMIYTLRLENDKYYIGKTNNLYIRLQNHKEGKACAWTSKYKFVELLETINTDDSFEEDKYTKKYMNQYGIDNVRGGSYSQVQLSDHDKKYLERELFHANGACLQCGIYGHFAKDCETNKVEFHQNCSRCGRINHSTQNCYAKTHLDGSKIENDKYDVQKICSRCGRINHSSKNCHAKKHLDGSKIKEKEEEEDDELIKSVKYIFKAIKRWF